MTENECDTVAQCVHTYVHNRTDVHAQCVTEYCMSKKSDNTTRNKHFKRLATHIAVFRTFPPLGLCPALWLQPLLPHSPQ